MAVYKIFPQADATIYSKYPTVNTGRDEILEVSALNVIDENGIVKYQNDVRRTLIQFSDEDINILKGYNSSSFEAKLKLFLAYADNLSLEYSVNAYCVSKSWVMGTGKFSDNPPRTNGVNWDYTGPYGTSVSWSLAGGDVITDHTASQAFNYRSDKDLDIDVSPLVQHWFDNDHTNNGFLVRLEDSVEQSSGSLQLKFFSVDTHTIYPPCLEFSWDDSNYNPTTGSRGMVFANDSVRITPTNIMSSYPVGSVVEYRVKASERFPARVFTTGSIYLQGWLYLSEETYWGLQDMKTGEMVIDFHETYTKVSADSEGNYFKIYTEGLQPERYYQVILKTTLYDTSFGALSIYTSSLAASQAVYAMTAQQKAILPQITSIVNVETPFKVVR